MLSRWSPELRLCVEACRRDFEGLASEAPIDWYKLRDLARSHHIEPLVGRALKCGRLEGAPDEIRVWFEQQVRHHEFQSLRTQVAAVQTTQVLAAHGIPSILLKGPAVSHRYYAHPGSRQNVDVDLLVREADAIRARSALEEAGFVNLSADAENLSAVHFGAYMRMIGAVVCRNPRHEVEVDLHWQAVRPHRLDWSYSALEDHIEELRFGGCSLGVLDNAAQFLFLTYHGAKHGWARLKWLADLDRMVPHLSPRDVETIWKLTDRDGTGDIVMASLEIYGAVFGRDLAGLGVDAARRRSANVARLGRYIEGAAIQKPFAEMNLLEKLGSRGRYYLYLWRWRRSLQARLQLIPMFLADRRHVQRLRLSERWFWLYVVAGPLIALLMFAERRWCELRSRRARV